MYNYKSNTFTNICTEKIRIPALKIRIPKYFSVFLKKSIKIQQIYGRQSGRCVQVSLGLKMYNAIIIIETDSITKESKRKSQMRITTFEDKKKRSVKNGKNFNQPV